MNGYLALVLMQVLFWMGVLSGRASCKRCAGSVRYVDLRTGATHSSREQWEREMAGDD